SRRRHTRFSRDWSSDVCSSDLEVRRLRRLGVTRVQLGVQSLDDRLLALNKRGHTVEDVRRAVRLLRGAGFKIALHWMPNLLGARSEERRVGKEGRARGTSEQ